MPPSTPHTRMRLCSQPLPALMHALSCSIAKKDGARACVSALACMHNPTPPHDHRLSPFLHALDAPACSLQALLRHWRSARRPGQGAGTPCLLRPRCCCCCCCSPAAVAARTAAAAAPLAQRWGHSSTPSQLPSLLKLNLVCLRQCAFVCLRQCEHTVSHLVLDRFNTGQDQLMQGLTFPSQLAGPSGTAHSQKPKKRETQSILISTRWMS